MMVRNQNDPVESIQRIQKITICNINASRRLATKNTIALQKGYRFAHGYDGTPVIVTQILQGAKKITAFQVSVYDVLTDFISQCSV